MMTEEKVRCIRCHRPLTNTNSVKLNIGPVCWKKIRDGNIEVDYGLPRSVSDPATAAASLRDLYQLVLDNGNRDKCTCGASFGFSDCWSFDHGGGREVAGFKIKQWVYLHCNRCKSDLALWKMGV